MMRRRLNSRCKGLIGIRNLAQGVEDTSFNKLKVQYLHKTVKDYIEKTSVQEKLLGMLKAPFDPHLRLCSGGLAICKTHEAQAEAAGDYYGQNYDFQKHDKLFQCMLHARQVQGASVPAMIGLLDELKITVSSHQGIFEVISFLGRAIGAHTFLTLMRRECFGNTFLSLAVKCQVLEYVKRRTERGCLVVPQAHTLGDVSLPYRQSHWLKKSLWNPSKFLSSGSDGDHVNSTDWPLLLDAVPSISTNPAMVDTLLRNGADPNFTIEFGGTKTSI